MNCSRVGLISVLSYNAHFLLRKAKEAKGKAAAKGSKFNARWVERDGEGRPLLKRSRSGETRKRASATGSPDLPRLFVITHHPIFLNSV